MYFDLEVQYKNTKFCKLDIGSRIEKISKTWGKIASEERSYSTYAEPFGVIDEMIGMMRRQFQLPIHTSERGWLHDTA